MKSIFLFLIFAFCLFTFAQAQNVGIGTANPAVKLAIAGTNSYDLAASEGDFRLGDSTYRLKMGVANSGAGAGDAYIASSHRLLALMA